MLDFTIGMQGRPYTTVPEMCNIPLAQAPRSNDLLFVMQIKLAVGVLWEVVHSSACTMDRHMMELVGLCHVFRIAVGQTVPNSGQGIASMPVVFVLLT